MCGPGSGPRTHKGWQHGCRQCSPVGARATYVCSHVFASSRSRWPDAIGWPRAHPLGHAIGCRVLGSAKPSRCVPYLFLASISVGFARSGERVLVCCVVAFLARTYQYLSRSIDRDVCANTHLSLIDFINNGLEGDRGVFSSVTHRDGPNDMQTPLCHDPGGDRWDHFV